MSRLRLYWALLPVLLKIGKEVALNWIVYNLNKRRVR
jgi:hypothetical protein